MDKQKSKVMVIEEGNLLLKDISKKLELNSTSELPDEIWLLLSNEVIYHRK